MINPAKAYTAAEYIEIMRRRIWFIVIPFILILAGAVGYTMFAPRLYKASTLILVSPQRIPESFVQPTVTSKVEERLQSIAQEVLSRTRLEQIINDLNLYQKERRTLSREEVVALMQKDIEIGLPTRKEESKGFFTISYIGHDPNIVTTVTNRLASQFIEENLKLREQQAEGTTEFMVTELAAAKAKLEQIETAVTEYKRRFIGELPEQRDANLKILEQLQNQYQRVGETLRAAQDRKLYIQKQLTDTQLPISGQGMAVSGKEGELSSDAGLNSSTDVTVPSPTYKGRGYYETRQSLTRLLEELKGKYTENHPDVIATREKLADLEANKDEITALETYDPRHQELENQLAMTDMEIARARDNEKKISAQIERYQARIEQTPAREQDMASLMREHESIKQTYEKLLKKSQDAQQAENLEKYQKGEQFRIIDPATIPEKPFSPDIFRILLIGLVVGIGGGFGLALVREQLDRSFYDSGDVEVALGLKVLATVPKIEEKAA